ncbi:bifunctional pyr operon transcriptional regulator/uracil phosphoribosyltransferase PyrR [candidate division NPL-UPA2 bacterium]|nr:bifunctional pyr operon transcriptional regulator/uracil phosphoribosyltransferase PyrR [candidate division NPL-UPA2 bacterium]
MQGREIEKALSRLAHEILERIPEVKKLAIIGIRTRGAYLAERIREKLKEVAKVKVPLGIMDITLYRDDLSVIGPQPVVHATEIPFDITGKKVVLVDDVLYTGRTVRAALDGLTDLGRPRVIQLAVLVDRGHRELPIRADYVGKNIPTSQEEMVEVRLKEVDGREEVVIVRRGE